MASPRRAAAILLLLHAPPPSRKYGATPLSRRDQGGGARWLRRGPALAAAAASLPPSSYTPLPSSHLNGGDTVTPAGCYAAAAGRHPRTRGPQQPPSPVISSTVGGQQL